MTCTENRLFDFRVSIVMTEEGLKPVADLYRSEVDMRAPEAEALEQAMKDCVQDWLDR